MEATVDGIFREHFDHYRRISATVAQAQSGFGDAALQGSITLPNTPAHWRLTSPQPVLDFFRHSRLRSARQWGRM